MPKSNPSLQPRIILDNRKFQLTLHRLCHQLNENHGDFSQSVLIGIQPRGIFFADKIFSLLKKFSGKEIPYGKLDITFYRDDFRTAEKPLIPCETDLDFSIENKKVVLIDDVLFTGRTIRSAMDALLQYGRPEKVELMVLVDRRFTRHVPIQPDYVGISIDTIQDEKVKVDWGNKEEEEKIWIMDK